ncbi:MAG: hypothetical protein C5B49_13750 [Bdellovibrio sp.]|nr:MAG: hypothetical protein C5B49_13750 [Bdellovibrio sp.]
MKPLIEFFQSLVKTLVHSTSQVLVLSAICLATGGARAEESTGSPPAAVSPAENGFDVDLTVNYVVIFQPQSALPSTFLVANNGEFFLNGASCSGNSGRWLGLKLRRFGAKNNFDMSLPAWSIIYSYFKNDYDCSLFVQSLLSASPSSPVHLKIHNNHDDSQSQDIELNNTKFTTAHESLWPF